MRCRELRSLCSDSVTLDPPSARALLLACALAVGACSNDPASGATGTGGGGSKRPDGAPVGISLIPTPSDLTTDHDATSTRIAATYQSTTSPGDVSQSLSLRTHPGDVLVATSVESEPFDAGALPPGGAWVLHPNEPLAPGWYALVLANGAGHFTGPSHHRDDGGWESRFRVGSDPLLIGVGACASYDTSLLPKLRLDFSEAVTLSAGPVPIEVVVAGVPTSCVVYEPPISGLTCTPPIPASAQVTVTIGTGIVSASSGMPLRMSTGALPHAFDLPASVGHEPCRHWHETTVPAN